MAIHDPSLTRYSDTPSNPLFALFRGRRLRDIEPSCPALLREIGGFLLTYELKTNPLTMTIGYDCVTGTNPLLVRRIEQRVSAGLPVTEAWLDEANASMVEESGLRQLTKVIERLDGSLTEFGKATHDARSATRDYNCALAEHGRELERHGDGDGKVDELVQLVQVMITKTRAIEREMAQSEAKSKSMREGLERAQRMAEEDYLTGLPNRRAFDRLLHSERALAREAGEMLCIGFCDIDHFKQINDIHGHDAGDRVLRAVARKLKEITNAKCHVARHGGEEFAVVFRGLTLDEARRRLDGAREDLATRKFINRETNAPIGIVTFSAGLVALGEAATISDALHAADKALYAAKNGGRNRVLLGECE